jgi:hypothetical protein
MAEVTTPLTGIVYDGRLVCMAAGTACAQCAAVQGTFLDPVPHADPGHVVVCVLCGHLVPGGMAQATCAVCLRTMCQSETCWNITHQRCMACIEHGVAKPKTGTLMALMRLYPYDPQQLPMINQGQSIVVDGVAVWFPKTLPVARFFTREPSGWFQFSYRPAGSFGMVLFGKLADGTPVVIKVALETQPLGPRRTVGAMERQPWFEPQIMCALGLHVDQWRFGLNVGRMPPLEIQTTRVVASGPARSNVWWLDRQFVTVLRPVFLRDAASATHPAEQLELLGHALWSELCLVRATGCTHGDLHRPNLAILADNEKILVDFGRAAPVDPRVATPRVLVFFTAGSAVDWTSLEPYWSGRMRKVAAQLWPTGPPYAVAVCVTHTLYMILASFLTDELLRSYNWHWLGELLLPLVLHVNLTRLQTGDQLRWLLHAYPVVLKQACDALAGTTMPSPPLSPPQTENHESRPMGNSENELDVVVVSDSQLREAMAAPYERVLDSVVDRVFYSDGVERAVYVRGRPDHPLKPRVEWRVAPPSPKAVGLHFIG